MRLGRFFFCFFLSGWHRGTYQGKYVFIYLHGGMLPHRGLKKDVFILSRTYYQLCHCFTGATSEAECFVISAEAVWECTQSETTEDWIQMVAHRQSPIIPRRGAGVHVWQLPLWNSDEMFELALDICNTIIYCSPSREQWTRLPPQSTHAADHFWLMPPFCFAEACIRFIVGKSET